MSEEPVQENPKGSGWVKTVGLFLAFMPSAFALGIINKEPTEKSVVALCVVSFICCFASSFMLFRRGTAWSIAFGVMFLMLNAFITVVSLLFLGCTAMMKS